MTGKRAHILVCDDETHLREMVGEYLVERGYQVTEAINARMMHQAIQSAAPDLIILDINLPGEDGLQALRTLRQDSRLPVIMLTAATDVIDRVVGLELGADDYLGKPVDLRELEARIKAVLRQPTPRGGSRANDPTSDDSRSVAVGTCRLDVAGARLFGQSGGEIPLTATEFSLLCLFIENRGRTLSRATLLDHDRGHGRDPTDRSIDLHISRLRRKIEINPRKPVVLRTVHGVGYIFD